MMPQSTVVPGVGPGVTLNADNPWPGLLPFHEADSAYFEGRREETEDLFRLVARERLTVLFGLSGLGKSSLLQAGLFPILRGENILPVYIRLDFSTAQVDLVSQVKVAIQHECELVGIDAPAGRGTETLWEYFHREENDFWSRRNRPVMPLLAVDQFEEVFTLGRLDAHRARTTEMFLEQLADLAEGRTPAALKSWLDENPENAKHFSFGRHHYKMLLSVREDFLAELETLRERMPSVALNRMRLQRMNGRAALRVVARAVNLVDLPVAEKIVRFVAAGRSDVPLENLDVEPALLSVVCRELNNKRQRLSEPKITETLLQGSHDRVLNDFYERTAGDLPGAVRSFIEEQLLTVSGFRNSVALDNALSIRGITPALIDQLVDRRLLRREDRNGVQRLELTHDLLIGVVRASRDRRRQYEEAERVRTALLEQQERERLQLEQAQEKEKRERERRYFRISAAVAVVFVFLTVFAIAASVVAFRARELADRKAMEARRSAEQAIRQEVIARANVQEAQTQKALAVQQTLEAERFRREAEQEKEKALAALKETRLATQAAVTVFSPSGEVVVTLSPDGTAWLWNAQNGRAIGQLKSVSSLILATFSPDGRYLATASADASVQLWELASFRQLARFVGHVATVRKIAFSPDGRLLATASDDKTARIWDVLTRNELAVLSGHKGPVLDIRFSPDGHVATTSSTDGTTRVWDIPNGRLMKVLTTTAVAGAQY
jgi:WD domain, G-beta repeat